MDINSISSAASLVTSQKVGDAVGITVAKKAMDIHSDAAAQLIDSIPSASSEASESHLGNNINVRA